MVSARDGDDRRLPGCDARRQDVERALIFGGGRSARATLSPSALLMAIMSASLDDALLDALQIVAAAGQQQHEEEVDHVGDRDLGLADADRLDDDDVEAGRLDTAPWSRASSR